MDVVDAGLGGEVEHGLDDPLADVGPAHLRQRQADVVEGDRQLHPREQQRRQRVLVDRVEQGVADGAVDVVERPAAARAGRSTRLRSAGSCSRLRPSPCQNSVGGVERSTSRTNPGRGIRLGCAILSAEVEGDLDRRRAGRRRRRGRWRRRGRRADRWPTASARPRWRRRSRWRGRTCARGGRRQRLGAVRVGADELGLAVPQPGEVERDLGRHAHQHDAAAGPGDAQGVGDRRLACRRRRSWRGRRTTGGRRRRGSRRSRRTARASSAAGTTSWAPSARAARCWCG